MLSQREKVFDYAFKKYGAKPEYLWAKFPRHAILRRNDNKKWFAVIMEISLDKLGLNSKKKADIINLKCDTTLLGFISGSQKGVYAAYHMNKNYWISVLLDGSVEFDELCSYVDMSYALVANNKRKIGSKKTL